MNKTPVMHLFMSVKTMYLGLDHVLTARKAQAGYIWPPTIVYPPLFNSPNKVTVMIYVAFRVSQLSCMCVNDKFKMVNHERNLDCCKVWPSLAHVNSVFSGSNDNAHKLWKSILIKTWFCTVMNSFTNSNSRKSVQLLIKKLQIQQICSLQIFYSINNYIIKTAPSRHNDHASEEHVQRHTSNHNCWGSGKPTPELSIIPLHWSQCLRSVNIDKLICLFI